MFWDEAENNTSIWHYFYAGGGVESKYMKISICDVFQENTIERQQQQKPMYIMIGEEIKKTFLQNISLQFNNIGCHGLVYDLPEKIERFIYIYNFL